MMKKILVLFTFLGLAVASQAVLVDNFESYATGKVVTPWTGIFAGTGAAVVAQEANGNKYGSWWGANNGARGMWRSLNENSIANTDAATTLYMRIMTEVATNDGSFGLTDLTAAPTTWGDFEVQVALINGILNARNGGTVVPLNMTFNPGAWYNIWVVINNSADTFDVYATSSGDATGLSPLADNFVFRNSVPGGVYTPQPNNLVSFLALANTRSTAQPFRIDNINVTPGTVLTVPEPASMLILGLGSLFLARCKK